MVEQPTRDLEAALHAPRKRAHAAAAPVPQLDHGEQLADARLADLGGDAVRVGVEAQVLLGAKVLVQRRLLED